MSVQKSLCVDCSEGYRKRPRCKKICEYYKQEIEPELNDLSNENTKIQQLQGDISESMSTGVHDRHVQGHS
jgi:hypothetical protein